MKKVVLAAVLVTLIVIIVPATLSAGTVTFNPGSGAVGNAINSDGFFVTGTPSDLFGAYAWSSGFSLSAYGAGYSDAGLVLFFDGGLTLGNLGSVSVSSTGSPLAVNLWLDTGGDGKFFSLGGMSGYQFTGLNGDSYAGCGAPTLTATSSCYMLGGNGAGSTVTLADLRSGLVSGIDANTPVALWIGVTNGGNQTQYADVNSITVTTVPEPGSLMLLGTGLLGVAGIVRRRFRR